MTRYSLITLIISGLALGMSVFNIVFRLLYL